jgi:hypothetical protein
LLDHCTIKYPALWPVALVFWFIQRACQLERESLLMADCESLVGRAPSPYHPRRRLGEAEQMRLSQGPTYAPVTPLIRWPPSAKPECGRHDLCKRPEIQHQSCWNPGCTWRRALAFRGSEFRPGRGGGRPLLQRTLGQHPPGRQRPVGKTPHASVFSDSPLRMSVRLGRHSCYLQFSGDGKVIEGSTMARY